MSTYFFNIFNKSIDHNITTILTFLDLTPNFFLKTLIFKNSKNLKYP